MKHKTISALCIVLVVLLILFGFYKLSLLVGVFWLGLTTWGAFDIRLGYFLPVFYRKKTNKKIIAITFDDGPTEFTPKVLDILEKHNAKATFFCIGKQIEKHPDICIRIHSEGHQIGNHSYSHSNSFGFFSAEKIKTELQKTDSLIEKITGKKNHYFRPPFGVTNPHIARAVKALNHKVIGWNIRSLDTVIEDKNKILNRITHKIQPGSIILLHDTSEKTLWVLEQLLLTLQRENYKTITIEKLLKDA